MAPANVAHENSPALANFRECCPEEAILHPLDACCRGGIGTGQRHTWFGQQNPTKYFTDVHDSGDTCFDCFVITSSWQERAAMNREDGRFLGGNSQGASPNLRYSIVIPAYNEASRLDTTLHRVLAYIANQGWNAEIIIVNDGSRDNTAEIVRGYAERNPNLRLLENPGNRGKGYSVRHGILNAMGDVVFFSDADLSSPIEQAPKLLAAINAAADVAIGSRWLQSNLQTQRQPLYRQLFGRIFNIALRVVLGLSYSDT